LGGAYLYGSLAQPEVGQMYADIILTTLTAYAMSHGWYAGILKKEEKKPPHKRRLFFLFLQDTCKPAVRHGIGRQGIETALSQSR